MNKSFFSQHLTIFFSSILLLFFLVGGKGFAQTTLVTVEGTITDEDGVPLPGVTIAAKNVDTGYDYSSIHPAIDIAGSTGHAIFASDSGVVVYSGWNDWGYGYVVVLDHGNGWQTLYAHLSSISVGCGQAVFQGQVIAAMGISGNSSGSHLHFEIMHDEYGKVNPWNYLP